MTNPDRIGMMTQNPSFSFMVHGGIRRANAAPENAGNLTIYCTDLTGNSVTIFTGDGELATKLADAINAVIDEHSTLNRAQQGIGRAA